MAGQLDDLAVALYALRTGLRGLPPPAATRHLASVGLSATALDSDLDNVRAGAGWTAAVVASSAQKLVGGSARAIGATAAVVGSAIARKMASRARSRS